MTKNEKLRNLLVAGINEAINRRGIILDSLEDTNGQFRFSLFGKPSKFSWSGISQGEVRVTIWWGIKSACKDNESNLPLNKNMNTALLACCSGWLERKDGCWLQGDKRSSLVDSYCSLTANRELNSIKKVKGNGFEIEGKFYM